MEFYYHQCFTVVILCLNLYSTSGRTAVEQVVKNEDGQEAEGPIRLHVITKREAMNDITQEYPRVNGRTHPASNPLDPNSATPDQASPQDLLDSFDTVNEIYQPQVSEDQSGSDNNNDENNNENRGEERGSETAAVSRTESDSVPVADDSREDDSNSQDVSNVQNDVSSVRPTEGSEYAVRSGAQPYPGSYSRSQYGTPGYAYSAGDLGPQRSMTQRRVVLAGRGPDTVSSNQRTPYYRGSSRSHSRQSQIPEVRGPYYGGRIYVDSSGHYVDAQGRRLDSTGRYYDISGRYPDAIMTRTVTYQGSGGSPNNIYRANARSGYDSGPGSGYYDNTRRGYDSYGRSGGGRLDSTGRYVVGGPGSRQVDQSRPVNSYGGTQFYSSGNTYQTTYNPVTSQISSDRTCTSTNNRITVYINDLECQEAITQLGRFVCYNYERVSTECCERCLQVKQADLDGCEYGDRSSQCESIRPSDCYNERNRQVCCNRCRHYLEQMQHLNLPEACPYGDRTQQCQSVARRSHLCYLPENQQVCCATCPRYANQDQPDCQWGNQSPEFCELFDAQRRVKINCYRQEVRDICCSSCRSLRSRFRQTIPGCEYGDYPILFYVGQSQLTCTEYIHQYGVASCDEPSLARQCCYTCYRYRQARG